MRGTVITEVAIAVRDRKMSPMMFITSEVLDGVWKGFTGNPLKGPGKYWPDVGQNHHENHGLWKAGV
jgi:hypothetical protein